MAALTTQRQYMPVLFIKAVLDGREAQGGGWELWAEPKPCELLLLDG